MQSKKREQQKSVRYTHDIPLKKENGKYKREARGICLDLFGIAKIKSACPICIAYFAAQARYTSNLFAITYSYRCSYRYRYRYGYCYYYGYRTAFAACA